MTPDELRTLFLFEGLSDAQVRKLADSGDVVHAEPGWLYREGDAATCFYVLLDGHVSLHHQGGGDDLEIGRTRQRGVYAGAWEAYLGDGAPAGYTSSLRVLEPSEFFVLPAATFGRVVREWFPMAVHLLEGTRIGLTQAQKLTSERERLLALGSLTAGLTHELGNPAAALARTLAQLQEELRSLEGSVARLAPGLPEVPAAGSAVVPGDPLRRNEAEDALVDALDELGVEDPEDLAPVLVEHGLAAADLPTDPGTVTWFARTVAVRSLVAEAAAASGRISALLASAGNYAQLDRAPERWVDVRELLDAAISMLGAGAGRAVGNSRVATEYADVPQVLGHTGELVQVWTNLLDNALDALGEEGGTVTVRVHPDADGVCVEVADDGPGVPPEVLPRIFEPFVTTKDVGQGTGLGLDIAWRVVVHRHRGRLSVDSVPGNTVFRVWLPVEPQED
ncbi:histidine kinase/DNA gyrase B/HSP90-like ATPase [Kineococcus rhizosphaerae]|uniref:histidine kinase n=1 Tax=Kineococcus rhizosphaerae TaxID=559628 RepID=A0A2T0R5S1_9ACTN|nr:histidine kinase/DNA gyrase B/HSP90-like ATPase [Kineococcus rhizosphaerae]